MSASSDSSTMREKLQNFTSTKIAYAVTASLIGLLLFLIIYGYAPLVPTNVAFLYNSSDGDLMSHQFGFDFYRYSPWEHPVGQTHSYPYPYASSVINSDSIPILAIPFKLLSPLLPEYFQYFGLWIVFCFIMQAVTAALLLKKLRVNFFCAMVSVPLFICNVPLLFRCFHHCALVGQWLILLAFLLILSARKLTIPKHALLWSALCGLSVMIHGYLFFIIGLLMTMDCFYLAITTKNIKKSVFTFIACVLSFMLCYYEGGGFVIHSNVLIQGLGDYTLDLADFFNPIYSSLFTPQYIPSSEGTLYLGAGILLLLLIALILCLKNSERLKHFYQQHHLSIILLTLASFLCIILSMGVCGRIAGKPIYDLRPYLTLSQSIALSAFRSSARFVWPVWYLLLLLIITAICRLWKHRYLPCCLLLFCTILQAYDVVHLSSYGATNEVQNGYESIWCESFDQCFSDHAKHISLIDNVFVRDAAVFAAHHRLTYNASKVGRGPKNSCQIDLDSVNSGELQNDTIYVLHLSQGNYLEPICLPSDYKIYICDDILCFFHESLLIRLPDENAVELPRELLPDLIEQLRELYGEPKPILQLEEI